ncbi:hypothetical protein ACFE04_011294 [Oxalis oulophora]
MEAKQVNLRTSKKSLMKNLKNIISEINSRFTPRKKLQVQEWTSKIKISKKLEVLGYNDVIEGGRNISKISRLIILGIVGYTRHPEGGGTARTLELWRDLIEIKGH